MSQSPLEKAAEIVGGARCETYGRPIDNHSCTAALWSAWMSRKLRTPITFTATDVCWFNILQKCSREANKHDDDNPVDVCGYAQNDWLCRQANIEDAINPCCDPDTLDAYLEQNPPPAAGSPMPEPQQIEVPKELLVYPDGTYLERWQKLPNRVIYVHGPFTNGGKLDARARHQNTDRAIRAGIELTKKGWLPHIPHAATGCLDYTTDLSYEDYMELDNTMLAASSSGFRVEGPSSGGDRENQALRDAGKPVWYNLDDVPDIRGQLRDAKITNDER